jgi:hypothetical protein
MFGFILNLPYTVVGLIISLLSIPLRVVFRTNPYAFVFHVKNLWWAISYMRNARAVAIGHVVILGPNLEDKDLEHELIHVEQYQRMPIIQPILYYLELLRKGYRGSKYENEAYQRAGNVYRKD